MNLTVTNDGQPLTPRSRCLRPRGVGEATCVRSRRCAPGALSGDLAHAADLGTRSRPLNL